MTVPKLNYRIEILLAAFAGLLLEVAYTRIFSFKVYYYFTYVILGMGLLGMALSGLALATSARLRGMSDDRLLGAAGLVGALSVPIGYAVISPLELNVLGDNAGFELAKLCLTLVCLLGPFAAVGLIIATILSRHPARAGTLYAYDLVGAALACALAVPALETLDPPGVIFLCGWVLAWVAWRPSKGQRRQRSAVLAVLVATPALVAVQSQLPLPAVAADKHYCQDSTLEYGRWNPVFRVDVCKPDPRLGLSDIRIVQHDGLPGSGLRRFDGDLSSWSRYEKDTRVLPFRLLPESPRVLVIGAAGGHELVASLYFGAEHVTGVELNPVTHSLVTDVFAEFTGNLHRHPNVTYLLDDGRHFLAETDDKFDLIWFVTPDSYAAMNASSHGAFVLSESYLYTVEAIRASLAHLTDRGVLCTAFGEWNYAERPNNTARYVSSARAALAGTRPGENFADHLLLASAPGFAPFTESVVMVGAAPFTEAQVARLRQAVAGIAGGSIEHAPTAPLRKTPVGDIIHRPAQALDAFYAAHSYELDPVYDDRPFFWHFVPFTDALHALLPGIDAPDEAVTMRGEQSSLVFLIVVGLLASLLLIAPLRLDRGTWRALPGKGAAFVFFMALGLGFMLVEVGMIQKLTLLLGYPTYSLTVTLFSLLAASGFGSMGTARSELAPVRLLWRAFLALALLLPLAALGLPWVTAKVAGQGLWLRVLVSALSVAPMGVCLGVFMPTGLRLLSRSEGSDAYAAWAWSVNGFFSVIASVLATQIAMSVGFRVLLWLALLGYLVAVVAATRLERTMR